MPDREEEPKPPAGDADPTAAGGALSPGKPATSEEGATPASTRSPTEPAPTPILIQSDDWGAPTDAVAAQAGEPKRATEAVASKPHAKGNRAGKEAPRLLPGAVSLRVGSALAIASGLLYFLGFPGVDLWPLSLVALVPLIVAMRHQPTRRAVWFGWLAGFTMTMSGFYWLLTMLKVFSGFGTPLCILFMAILCAYQGGRIGLCGWFYGRAANRGWPAAPVFALGFAASELLYPLLFPWYFAASVHNRPELMQTADLGGPILVGLVLVASNLAVAEIVNTWRDRRAPDRRLIAVGFAVPVIAAVYGLVRMRSVDAAIGAAEHIKVGVVQPNLQLFDRTDSVLTHLDLTRKLREQHVDLVIFSEGGIARAWPESRYQLDVSRNFAKSLGVPTVIGTLLVRPDPGGVRSMNQWFNTALLADEKGAIVGRYDKEYLLAFGEYIPFGDTFPSLYAASPNSSHFSSGTSLEPLIWGKHRLSTMICYEDILPSYVNKMVAHAKPDLLVNMTNDAWFGDSTEPWIHLALAKLRAVEHRRYLVRATNSGVSAIVDADGRVTMHGSTFTAEPLTGDVAFLSSSTVFETLGDVPWWLAAVAITLMSFFSRPRKTTLA